MLNKQQLKYLRSLAHERKPVIWIGQHGLSESVMDEINLALTHHELIKIKIRVGDKEEREKVCSNICRLANADLIQKIGNTATVFRRNPESPIIQLPK